LFFFSICVTPPKYFVRLPEFVLVFSSTGYPQNIWASLIVAWGVYLGRNWIRNWFRDEITYIRAPMMFAIAPLILVRRRIGQQYGLNVDLDFRYAGKQTLEDVFSGECFFGVASDVALCSALTKAAEAGTARSVYVLPFVRIEDHLKLLVRKNEDGTSSISHVTELIDKQIGYCPDSIHDHFLAAHGLEPNMFSTYEMTNVLDGYRNSRFAHILASF
jgi:hypothetical protein